MSTRPVEYSYDGSTGIFHRFSTNAEGAATAIVELPDGTVRNIPVEHIKFMDRGGSFIPMSANAFSNVSYKE